MTMKEEFKKYSNFSEFMTDKIKFSAEFNRKKLQILYQNLKNMLKVKIFENLEHVQRNLEENLKRTFSDDLAAFKKYKKTVQVVEAKINEISSLQKDHSIKESFIFTRLNKLQEEVKQIKEADNVFKNLTEICLRFNIENELNFQFFENLILFKNQSSETDKMENFQQELDMLFEKNKKFTIDLSLSPIHPHGNSFPERLNTMNIQRKMSMNSVKGNLFKNQYTVPTEKNKSFISIDNSTNDYVPALSFIESKNFEQRRTLNPDVKDWSKPKLDLRSSAVTHQNPIRKNQKNSVFEISKGSQQNFSNQLIRTNTKTGTEHNKLFKVQNNCAIVSGLTIDLELLQNILNKIPECESFISQIIFKNNSFVVNPISAFLVLFDGKLNERMVIDLRKNSCLEGRKFSKDEVSKLENLNVFVLI